MKAVEIKKDIYWVGAQDPSLRIFDIVMYTPFGTTYNSYVVKGSEKTVVFDTVKEYTFNQYIERLEGIDIDVSKIDYIIVSHTEPDHSGSVAKMLDIAKNAKVVASAMAIRYLKGIVNRDFHYIEVRDGDSLSLGNKTLKFINAPFLHWPDTIYTYIEEDKLLVTCDSFGAHYSTETLFDDFIENQVDYDNAFKYYYEVIMSPFKKYVLKAIDSIKDLQIDIIAPGHGPILRKSWKKAVELYKKWSTPKEPSNYKKVVICYVSAYGYTRSLANKIEEALKTYQDIHVVSYDVTYSKMEDILKDLEDADGMLFGSPTINGDALKPIWDILVSLSPIVHERKKAAAFGSYGWSGEAVPDIEARLSQLRMDVLTPGLKVNFKPAKSELDAAFKFGESFGAKVLNIIVKDNYFDVMKTSTGTAKSLAGTDISKRDLPDKKWQCIICGLILSSPELPKYCPVCGAGSDQFVEIKEEAVTFQSDKKETVVIIGNGASGYYAAEAIRQRNKVCDIEIISKENYLTYYRPQLSDYLSKTITTKDLYVMQEGWYKENNIKLTLGFEVKRILPVEKTVVLSNGEQILYDKLIIASGSYNFLPSLPGLEIPGVFTLRSLEDADKIKLKIKTSKKAIVIGGGLLGLEAAFEMRTSGIEVTVVETFKRLLPRQLDEETSELFLKKIQNSGINIILGDSAAEILGDENVEAVKLKSGIILDTDMVLFSVGIRASKSLADKSGIATKNGILVNEKMETSSENIYSCGDCAEFQGKLYGIWPAAQEMGRIAGANAAGDNVIFKNFVLSSIFDALGVELFSAGEVNDSEAASVLSGSADGLFYKKLFYKGDKLIGAILIGNTKESTVLLKEIQG